METVVFNVFWPIRPKILANGWTGEKQHHRGTVPYHSLYMISGSLDGHTATDARSDRHI